MSDLKCVLPSVCWSPFFSSECSYVIRQAFVGLEFAFTAPVCPRSVIW